MDCVAAKRKREPFTQKPHRVVFDKRLTLPARHLYDIYKAVCGENPNGACWMTMKKLMEVSGLSAGAITKARRLLQELGYIRTKQRRRSGRVGHSLVVKVVNIWQYKDVGGDSTDGGLQKPGISSYTPVQSDTTKSRVARDAMGASHEMRCNKNQLNKNHFSSSSTSNEIEHQTTHRRRGASSERHPAGENPSGSTNSGIEETRMSNRLQSQTNQPQDTRMAGFDLDDVGGPPLDATYDDLAAGRLIEAVARKMKLLRKPRMDVWSKDIARFRRLNEVSEADFEERLVWFIDHIDDPFMPIVHSAKGFCDKIDQIGAARVRSETPTPAKQGQASRVQTQLERLKEKGMVR